jgi:hypothetical protein
MRGSVVFDLVPADEKTEIRTQEKKKHLMGGENQQPNRL